MGHTMSVSYPPKVQGVRDGTICHTIRKVGPRNHYKHPGQDFLIFAWTGKPYRSPWSWKMKVKLTGIYHFVMGQDGVHYIGGSWDGGSERPEYLGYPGNPGKMGDGDTYPWTHPLVNLMAKVDGIDPPTGMDLKAVLMTLYGIDFTEPTRFIAVTWKVV